MTDIPEITKTMHHFSLVRLRKECYFAPISVDFTPAARPNQSFQSILPHFNRDRDHCTPAFFSPYEQFRPGTAGNSCFDFERERFMKKIEENLSLPEPQTPKFSAKDDRFCSICKLAFECYWDHINSEQHRRLIKSSKANRYIYDLCKRYKQSGKIKDRSGHQKKSQILKQKKIGKSNKKRKCEKKQLYKVQDFIIRLPRSLLEKDQPNFNINTNGITSLQEKP